MIVGFIHAWSPVAMYSGKILDGLRRAGDLSFAKVFILDADINTKEYFEDVETFSTPSLAFFAGGKAMKIHQPGKKLATALPGQLTKAQVWPLMALRVWLVVQMFSLRLFCVLL